MKVGVEMELGVGVGVGVKVGWGLRLGLGVGVGDAKRRERWRKVRATDLTLNDLIQPKEDRLSDLFRRQFQSISLSLTESLALW